jgi:TPR repeat protein
VSVGRKKELAEVPALSGKLTAGSIVNMDVDADVAVLYEKALDADGAGKDNPAAAQEAWKKLGEAPGKNPYKEDAARRAVQWAQLADDQRKLADQKNRDHEQLVKLLPLKRAVTDALKEELLLRYARLYGPGDVEAMLRLIPSDQARSSAQAAVECELAKKADRCEQAAALHEAAKAYPLALQFHEKGCQLGSGSSCERLGTLLLGAEGVRADPQRAQLMLQRACEAGTAAGCRRLAQGLLDGSLGQRDPARVTALYGRGCELKDAESCAASGNLERALQPGISAVGIPYYRQACELRHQESCRKVADYEKELADAKEESARIERDRIAQQKKIADDAQRERDRIAEIERKQREALVAERDGIRMRRSVGIGFVVAGAALAGGATFFALKGKSTNDQLTGGGAKTAAEQQSILDQGKTYNTLGFAFAAAAVAGVGIGVPLIMFNSPSKEPKISLVPAPGGMLVSWRWP